MYRKKKEKRKKREENSSYADRNKLYFPQRRALSKSGLRGVDVVSECSKKRLSQGQKQLTLLNSATPSLTKYPLIFPYSLSSADRLLRRSSGYNSISLFSPLPPPSLLSPHASALKSKVYAHVVYIQSVHY